MNLPHFPGMDEFIFAPSPCDTIASWLHRASRAEPDTGSFRVHCLRYGINGQERRFRWGVSDEDGTNSSNGDGGGSSSGGGGGVKLANSAGRMELLLQSHTRRGPSPFHAAERATHDECAAMAPQSSLSAGVPLGFGDSAPGNSSSNSSGVGGGGGGGRCPFPECRDANDDIVGRSVCSQSDTEEPGKSLFRSDRCAVPGLHYCVGEKRTRRWADVHGELRCNHYYIRSAEDVAIKAGWHKRARRFVPAVAKCQRFWNAVEDKAVLDAHPGLLGALRQAMAELAGGARFEESGDLL